MAENIQTTLQFQADITDFKGAMQEAKRAVNLANSEFKATASSMDDWSKSTEGLQAKIRQLTAVQQAEERKLAVLKTAYRQIVDEQGESSAAAQEYAAKINNQQAAVNKITRDLKQYATRLDEVENGTDDAGDAAKAASKDIGKAGDAADAASKDINEMDDAADDAGGSLDALGTVAKGVTVGIAAVGAAVAAAITGFLATAEATREYRTQMAKLTTAFEDVGVSAEDGKEVFQDFYGVLGDQDKATEAVSNLVMLTQDQKALSEWTTIATGVYAKFGDALPIESLTEAANETAKTGTLTGALADALNWAGVNEEEFQAKLDACTTTQEREALIRQTLNGLYADAGEAYRATNADLIAANKASARLTDAMAAIGAIAEPIMTSLKNHAAGLLETITPFVALIGEGLTGALNGTAGAADKLAEGLSGIITKGVDMISQAVPVLLETVTAMLPQVLASITNALPAIVEAAIQIIPMLVETLLSMLPTLLESLLSMVTQIIEGLAAMLPDIVQAIVEVIPMLIESLIAMLPDLLDACITLLMALVDAIPVIIDALIEALPSIINALLDFLVNNYDKVIDAAITMMMALIDAIPVIIDALIEALPEIISAIVQAIIAAAPKVLAASVKMWFAMATAGGKLLLKLPGLLLDMIGAILKGLLDGLRPIGEAAGKVFSAIWDAIKSLPGKALEVGGNLMKSLGDKMSSGLRTVGNVAGRVGSTIWDAIKSLPDKFLSVGGNLVKGLWEGLKNSFSWIKDKISGWVGNVMDFIKGLFGIHSPSTLFRDEVGEMLGLGMAEGIMDSRDAVNKAVRKLGNAATSGLSAVNVGGTGAAGGRSVVFNQYNNSPKALNRREIYRQTHNALAYAGGV